jgi:hypothetical protein
MKTTLANMASTMKILIFKTIMKFGKTATDFMMKRLLSMNNKLNNYSIQQSIRVIPKNGILRGREG